MKKYACSQNKLKVFQKYLQEVLKNSQINNKPLKILQKDKKKKSQKAKKIVKS